MLLPIISSKKLTTKDKSQIVLAGDVGATETNLALFKTKGNAMVSIAKKEFASKDYKNICGPGIVNIYNFLRDEKKRKESEWLTKKMKEVDAGAIISQHADKSSICKETLEHFIRYLAYESANIVLKSKATGGLFIGGGIAQKLFHYSQAIISTIPFARAADWTIYFKRFHKNYIKCTNCSAGSCLVRPQKLIT